MKSKKLIRNVLVMLVAVMTTVMVMSSCGNAADSECANITIHLSGSGSGRAISSEEKSAATFNVYFNDSQVASNVSGTYNGTAQVGTRLNVRVDALVNGKRIACGENTITVMAGTNNVAIKLNENREEKPVMELKGIPQIGSIIMNDGTLRISADIGSDTADAIAVVYKVDTNARKAWAVGKVLSSSSMAWATTSAAGYSKNITGLQDSNYSDGSTGLAILRKAVPDADDTNLATNYPAWDYACNYGIKQNLTSFQIGWYLPCKQELEEVYNQKNNMPSPLINFSNNYYWSSSQYASTDNLACEISFGGGSWNNATKGGYHDVCAVRQFTY